MLLDVGPKSDIISWKPQCRPLQHQRHIDFYIHEDSQSPSSCPPTSPFSSSWPTTLHCDTSAPGLRQTQHQISPRKRWLNRLEASVIPRHGVSDPARRRPSPPRDYTGLACIHGRVHADQERRTSTNSVLPGHTADQVAQSELTLAHQSPPDGHEPDQIRIEMGGCITEPTHRVVFQRLLLARDVSPRQPVPADQPSTRCVV